MNKLWSSAVLQASVALDYAFNTQYILETEYNAGSDLNQISFSRFAFSTASDFECT